jgi:hypothetical protein
MLYELQQGRGYEWIPLYKVGIKGQEAEYIVSLEKPLSQFIDETGCAYYTTLEGRFRLIPVEQ